MKAKMIITYSSVDREIIKYVIDKLEEEGIEVEIRDLHEELTTKCKELSSIMTIPEEIEEVKKKKKFSIIKTLNKLRGERKNENKRTWLYHRTG